MTDSIRMLYLYILKLNAKVSHTTTSLEHLESYGKATHLITIDYYVDTFNGYLSVVFTPVNLLLSPVEVIK